MPTSLPPQIDPALAAAVTDAFTLADADQDVIDELFVHTGLFADAIAELQWRACNAVDGTTAPRRAVADASALLAAVTVLVEGAAR